MDFVALMLTLGSHGSLAVLVTLLGLAVVGIVAAPGAEGAAPAEGDPAPGAEPVAEGAEAEPAGGERQAAGEEEELDEDEVDLPDEVRNDPKRLRTRYRRLQRQHGTVARIAEQFRGPDGRYLPPEEINRLRGRAQDMDEMQSLLDEHPDLVQQILQRRNGRAAAAEPAEEAWVDPYAAQLADLPFDPQAESSRWFLKEFARLDKRNHDLQTSLKKLEQGVGTVQQRDQQRSEQQVEGAWKSQTLEAAKTAGLQGEDLEDFVNTVYANFRAAKAERRLEKIDRKQIIERALRPFRRTRAAGTRQTAVAAHTRAEGNRTLPAPHGRAAASPAKPGDTNKVGTIKDGRLSFFKRLEMQAPPGR